jgi:hypothetical protein
MRANVHAEFARRVLLIVIHTSVVDQRAILVTQLLWVDRVSRVSTSGARIDIAIADDTCIRRDITIPRAVAVTRAVPRIGLEPRTTRELIRTSGLLDAQDARTREAQPSAKAQPGPQQYS